MQNVFSALQTAQVPAFRGAFRPTAEYPEPPAAYCVYTLSRSPEWAHDDAERAERVRAFLHLYSLSDPEETEAAIESAMRAQGFALIRVTDGDYAEGAGLYEILSEWETHRHGPEI